MAEASNLAGLRYPVRLSRFGEHAPAGFGAGVSTPAAPVPAGTAAVDERRQERVGPGAPSDPGLVEGDPFSPFGEAIRSLALTLMPAPMSLAVQTAESLGYQQDLGLAPTLDRAMQDLASNLNPFSDHMSARSVMANRSNIGGITGPATEGPPGRSRSGPANAVAAGMMSKGKSKGGRSGRGGPGASAPSPGSVGPAGISGAPAGAAPGGAGGL